MRLALTLAVGLSVRPGLAALLGDGHPGPSTATSATGADANDGTGTDWTDWTSTDRIDWTVRQNCTARPPTRAPAE
jgi:hypothetical protein